MGKVLEVKDLKTYFTTDDGVAKAVDGVGFSLDKGRALGIVGESGCGKSVVSLSVMGLVPQPFGKIVSGEILFEGRDLLKMNGEEMRKVRGNRISMIFQEPMTALNPVFTVGSQIAEVFTLHQGIGKKDAWAKSVDMLRLVGIPAPESRAYDYPHQLSGGMRQRVMIAMALACNPTILIADEPTTALDVTIQAQILELMGDLITEFGTSIIFITHDLGVISQLCDDVMVMYAGKTAEYGPLKTLFEKPLHPYTEGLLHSVPSIRHDAERLDTIEGIVPNIYDMPRGCHFAPRCKYAAEKCSVSKPALAEFDGRQVSCYRYSGQSESEAVNNG